MLSCSVFSLFSLFIQRAKIGIAASRGQNAPALTHMAPLAHHYLSTSLVVARGDGHGHVGEALGGLVHVHVRAVGDGVEQLVARHLRTRGRGLGGEGQG